MAKQSPLFMSWYLRGENKQDIHSLFIIGIVWFVMAAIVKPIGDFPLNDDWVYALAVRSVLESGYFQFPSPSMANVGPQVYWGALFCLPFGFSFTALRFSTLVLGFIGVVALYALLRELKADSKPALIGALTLAVNPLYFGLSNSFMTDVPFISLILVAVYFLMRGLQRDSSLHIGVGLAITFLAILIRQFSLVILLGFALAYPIKKGFTFVNLAKVTGLVLSGALLHIIYQYWLIHSGRTPVFDLHTLPNLSPPSLLNSAKKATVALIYVGFFVLPFVTVFLSTKIQGIRNTKFKYIWIGLIAYVVILLGFLWTTNQKLPLIENILMDSGLGPLTLRDTFNLKLNIPIIPEGAAILWDVMTFLSVLSLGASLYLIGRATYQAWGNFKLPNARAYAASYALIAVMGVAYLAILLLVVARYTLFDRYLLLFLPIVVVLIGSLFMGESIQRGKNVIPIILIVMYGVFSVGATHDFLEWNRTRWVALNDLVQSDKISPRKIDGGYEFNGWFLYDAKYKQSPTKSWWWVDDDEYVLTSGPLPGYTEVKRYPVNRWLKLTASDIIVLRRIPQTN